MKSRNPTDDSFDDRAPLGTNGRPHYVELPIDDICPGKFVTPCRGPFLNHLHLCELGPMNVTSEDRRFHGYPMQVLAVSLPYVSLRMMSCPANGQMLFAYDVRDVAFREVSEAYVKSLVQGVVDQGSLAANGGVESTNPHPAPEDLFVEQVKRQEMQRQEKKGSPKEKKKNPSQEGGS